MRTIAPLAVLALGAAALAAAPAAAHDGVDHGTSAEAAAHAADDGASVPPTPFPVDIEAEFDLVDQTGAPRRDEDFAGRPMLLFFGYANCESICSVALPRMADAVELAEPEVVPVLVTVDPARDTPEAMHEALAAIHPRFVGLTGSADALAAARAAFQVESSLVTDGPAGPIYAHGSFIYLIGADGKVKTLMPPILSGERMAELVARYVPDGPVPAPGSLTPGDE